MTDELKLIVIHGKWKTRYNLDSEGGLKHLQYDLDLNECLPFFEQAKRTGSAHFEDDEERQYTLMYNRNDFSYTIIRRKS